MSQPTARQLRPLLGVSTRLTTRWTCPSCLRASRSQRNPPKPTRLPVSGARSFGVSAPALKKAGKRARDTALSDSSPPGPAVAFNTSTDELYDFSTLEAQILKAIERLTHKLSELRAGGRFNPAILEGLRVTVDKGSKATARLSDIAQIIPRGRIITVIVGEEAYVKPVSSAILGSPHSLNPQGPTRDAPTTLTITIPPPTGEGRAKAVEDASKSMEEAGMAIKAARQAHHKKMRALEVAKKVRPDDLQKAQKQMEEVVKRGQDETKAITESAKKVLQSA